MWAAMSAEAAPQIFCEAPGFDFGSVRDTQTVCHVFHLRNTGDQSLEMQQPHASCGCTAVTAGTLLLKPGETTEIRATVDLRGRSGQQHKTITIDSNDPATPKLTLTLQLDIWQEFRLLPSQLVLGTIRGDASVQTSVLFENNSARAVTVTNVFCSHTSLEVRVQSEQPGRKYRVAVNTRPPLSDGPLIAELRLQTDDPTHPEFAVNYACHVRGLLTVTPPRIAISRADTGGVTKSFILSPGTEKSFRIVDVQTPDATIKAEWQPYAVPGSYRVLVHNLAYRQDLEGRSIKVITDLNSIQSLHVPLDLEPAAASAGPP